MLAILAVICFVIAAIGIGSLGPVLLVPLGLAFLAGHFLWSYTPWTRRP